MPDLVFLDTETLGLDPYDPIWELSAIRRCTRTGHEDDMTIHVLHDRSKINLPERFLNDYRARYNEDEAITPYEAAHALAAFCHGKPSLVGANPAFDAERIGRQWLERVGIDRPWHYHLHDIETIAMGYLQARKELPPGPWRSDQLSALLGIDPKDYDRHTAMGDVLWVRDQWDVVFPNASENPSPREVYKEIHGQLSIYDVL